MSQEYRIAVGIDSTEAVKGSDEFSAAIDRVTAGATRVVDRIDAIQASVDRLASGFTSTGERTIEVASNLEKVGNSATAAQPQLETFTESLRRALNADSLHEFAEGSLRIAAAQDVLRDSFNTSLIDDFSASLKSAWEAVGSGSAQLETAVSSAQVFSDSLDLTSSALSFLKGSVGTLESVANESTGALDNLTISVSDLADNIKGPLAESAQAIDGLHEAMSTPPDPGPLATFADFLRELSGQVTDTAIEFAKLNDSAQAEAYEVMGTALRTLAGQLEVTYQSLSKFDDALPDALAVDTSGLSDLADKIAGVELVIVDLNTQLQTGSVGVGEYLASMQGLGANTGEIAGTLATLRLEVTKFNDALADTGKSNEVTEQLQQVLEDLAGRFKYLTSVQADSIRAAKEALAVNGDLAEAEEAAVSRIQRMVAASLHHQQELFKQNSAIKEQGQLLLDLGETVEEFEEKNRKAFVDPYKGSFEDANTELRVFNQALRATADTFDDLIERRAWLADIEKRGLLSAVDVKDATIEIDKAERDLIRTIERKGAELDTLLKKYDPLTFQVQQLEKDEKLLQAALKAGTVTTDAYAKAIENLTQKRQALNTQGTQGPQGPQGPPDVGGAAAAMDLLSSKILHLAGVASGLMFFKSAAAEAAELEVNLRHLQSSAGLTAGEISTLEEELKKMAVTFESTQVLQTAAALQVIKRGYRETADVVAVMTAANLLADATLSSTEASATSLSQVMASFGMSAGQATDAMETLMVASGGSAQEMSAMATMTARLGAQVSQAGVSLEDYSAVLKTLKQSGMESRRAMSGLTQLIEGLTNMAPEATVRFREWGIEVSKARIANEGLAPVMQEIYAKTKGNKAALTELLGSQQASTVFLKAMTNGGKDYAKVLDMMANKTAITAEAQERMNNTWEKQSQHLKEGIVRGMTRTGEAIRDMLFPVLKLAVAMIDELYVLLASAAAWGAFVISSNLASAALLKFNKTAGIVAIQYKATIASMVAAATTGTAKIALAFSVLGRAIAAAIIGWEVGTYIREALLDNVRGFEEFSDVVMNIVEDLGEGIAHTFQKALANSMITFNRIRLGWAHTIGDDRAVANANNAISSYRNQLVELEQTHKENNEASARAREHFKEQLRLMREGGAALMDLRNSTTAGAEGVAELGDEFSSLNEKYQSFVRSAVMSDPVQGVRRRIAATEEAIREVQANKGDPRAAEWLAGLNHQLEELQVQAHKVSLQRGPMREFLDSLAAGALPAVAASQAYRLELETLALALRLEALTHEQYAEAVTRTALSYAESQAAINPLVAAHYAHQKALLDIGVAQGKSMFTEAQANGERALSAANLAKLTAVGTTYEQAVRAITGSLNPAIIAQQQFDENLAFAKILLADNTELLAAYTREQEILLRQTLELNEVQHNSIVGLVASYDPLIKAELDRELALIKLRAQVDLLAASEAEREVIYADMARVIDENFEKTKRGLDENIDMAKVWEEAWKQTIARVDGAFVDLWESAFSGFESFADQLKTSFKRLLAELAHARFTKPLLEQFAGLFGNVKEKAPSASAQVREMAMEDLKKRTGISGSAGPLTKKDTTEAVYDALVRFEREKELGNMLHGGSEGGVQLGSLSSAIGDLNSTYAEGSKVLEKFGVKIQNPFEGMDFDLPNILVGGGEAGSGGDAATAAARAVQEAISGKSGSGGIMGQIGNLMTAFKLNLGNFGASFSTMFKGFLQGNYMSGSQLGTAMQSGASGYGAVAGQLAAGAGVGYLSGSVVNSVLGDRGKGSTTDALSAIGGAIGSAWGPLGSVIGGALGSFASNLIGGGKKIMDKGYELTVQSGALIGQEYEKIKKYGSFFSSKTIMKRSDMDDELFNAINAQFKESSNFLKDVAKSLDLSTKAIEEFSAATIKISTKGKKKTPEQIQAEIEQQLINIAGKQIDTFLSQTEGVTDRFRAMVDMFRPAGSALSGFSLALFNFATGTKAYTKEFIEAFRLVSVLEKGFQMVPEVEADKLIAEANKTQTQKYLDLADAAVEASREFDGSIESLAKVTEAFMIQREAAVLLAVELKKAAEEITGMFSNTAQSIRESLMTDEELYNYRKALVEQSAVEIEQTTDPGELRRLSNIINSTINELYRSFDDTQKEALAPGYLEFLDGISERVLEQIDLGLAAVNDSASDINDQVVGNLMPGYGETAPIWEQAAAQQLQAANTFANSTEAFAAAVQAFLNGTGPAPVAYAPTTTVNTSTTSAQVAALYHFLGREVNA